MKPAVILPVLAALALAAPPLDPWLDRSMARHMLVQVPLLLLLGFAVGAQVRRGLAPFVDDLGLTGLAAAVGALVFWMLPRSLDAAVESNLVDQLMHVSMFTAGTLLGAAWQRLPFAARGAVGIQLAAMLIAVGNYYAKAYVLACSAYTLELQQEAGRAMLGASVLVVLLVVVGLGRALSGERAPRRTQSPASSMSSASLET